MRDTKKLNLLKRRRIAVVALSVAVVMLLLSLVFVLDYVRSTEVTDPADNTVYYVKYRDGRYVLCDTDKKTVLPTDDSKNYVTRASTLIKVDEKTGKYTVVARVALENDEATSNLGTLILFPRLNKKDIRQIDVYNSHGEFTFWRYNVEAGREDDAADFSIKGYPLALYDEEAFIELYVAAGYTTTSTKVQDPIGDKEAFYEYGLAPEMREKDVIDPVTGEPTGEVEQYYYTPSYYVITSTEGKQYKVIIGDKLVTGGGYYVQYVRIDDNGVETKTDAVYVISYDLESTLLAPIESFATPALTYPMTNTDFMDVENFTVLNRRGDTYSEPVVGFTFVPLTERQKTPRSSHPFEFMGGSRLDGYMASADNIYQCLRGLYAPEFVGVAKFGPSMEDFEKYGLAVRVGEYDNGEPRYALLSEYIISFNFDAKLNGKTQTINERIYVSAPNEAGKYYAFTEIYSVSNAGNIGDLLYTLDMIVEVEGHTLEFLNWDKYKWINKSYLSMSISFADKISISSPDYSAVLDVDNSKSEVTDTEVMNDMLFVEASDSKGNTLTTFAPMTFADKSGYVWIITANSVTKLNSSGKEVKFEFRYENNKIGKQAAVLDTPIVRADGANVYVRANEVRIDAPTASESVTYVRYSTTLFRSYYAMLAASSITDKYEMTPEEEAALVADESKWLATLTVEDTEGTVREIKFYRLTSRKAYMTINGNGGFYVLANRVDKFISDTQRFFAGESISMSTN